MISADDEEFGGYKLQPTVKTQPWSALLEEAENHYYGHGEYLQDLAEAIKSFRGAARLGSPEAYQRLGDIYGFEGEVTDDAEKSLEFYKGGPKRGNYHCYVGMAKLFVRNKQVDNCKAMQKFIDGGESTNWEGFQNLRDSHLAGMELVLFTANSTNCLAPLAQLLRPYIPKIIRHLDSYLNDARSTEATKEFSRKLRFILLAA